MLPQPLQLAYAPELSWKPDATRSPAQKPARIRIPADAECQTIETYYETIRYTDTQIEVAPKER